MLAGYLVFGVAIAGLLGIGRLMNTDWREVFERFQDRMQGGPPAPPSHAAPRAKTTVSRDEY